MPVLNVLISLVMIGFPRAFAGMLWASSGWFDGTFGGRWLPAMGVAFMPYSLLWFSAVHNVFHGAWGGLQACILCLAVLADLGCWGWVGEARD